MKNQYLMWLIHIIGWTLWLWYIVEWKILNFVICIIIAYFYRPIPMGIGVINWLRIMLMKKRKFHAEYNYDYIMKNKKIDELMDE